MRVPGVGSFGLQRSAIVSGLGIVPNHALRLLGKQARARIAVTAKSNAWSFMVRRTKFQFMDDERALWHDNLACALCDTIGSRNDDVQTRFNVDIKGIVSHRDCRRPYGSTAGSHDLYVGESGRRRGGNRDS